jgi:hypothetical protein
MDGFAQGHALGSRTPPFPNNDLFRRMRNSMNLAQTVEKAPSIPPEDAPKSSQKKASREPITISSDNPHEESTQGTLHKATGTSWAATKI